eukprot:4081240-Prorocentrum_lima.AAC.1
MRKTFGSNSVISGHILSLRRAMRHTSLALGRCADHGSGSRTNSQQYHPGGAAGTANAPGKVSIS